MTKLAKYLKPFSFGLIAALLLLFGQAICDLNLPNLMSDIVNVGVSQNGIENAAPEAISKDGMRLMTAFMDDAGKKLYEDNYFLAGKDDKNAAGKTYAELYPEAGEELYVKKDVTKEVSAELDTAFGVSTWTFINFVRDMPGREET